MARYTGPVCRLCRREGDKLYLKGERCFSPKCAIERRNQPPGQHGLRGGGRRKVSDFGLQLREKQKARRIYGVLERQFQRYFASASKKSGVTGAALMQFLETRLDNIVYRLGWAPSRKAARQLIVHGHLLVNERKVTIPTFQVKPGETIAVAPVSTQSRYFKELDRDLRGRKVPDWLSLDGGGLKATMLSLPTREQIDTPLREQLIVEYYSR